MGLPPTMETSTPRSASKAAPTANVPLVGHRGLSHFYPENTAAAVDGAIVAGLEGVEIDLRASRDGVPFLLHDPRLRRIAERNARIDELDAIDVSRTRVTFSPPNPAPQARAATIPSFEAVYTPRADAIRWYVEIKYGTVCVDEVARIWRERPPLSGSACMSFDRSLCRRARSALSPEILVARIHQETPHGGPLQTPLIEEAKADGLDAIALWHLHLTPSWVQRAHDAGLTVIAWTVNEPSEIEDAVAARVDVLITDGPAPVLTAFGKSAPVRS